MTTLFAILKTNTKHLVCIALVCFVSFTCGCRRSSINNPNANRSTSTTGQVNGEQALREAQSLVEKGKELYKNDQDEQAAQAFEQAVHLQPEMAEAHLRLGMAYAALEKKDEAEESYKKALQLYKKQVEADPKDATAYFYLGEAHSFLHHDEDAARAYRQATRLKPDDEEAFYQLGKAEAKLANYDGAAAAFQKALELDPDDSRASDGLEDARAGVQRIREGKKHAEEMLKQQQENENANGNINGNFNLRPRRTVNANSNSSKRPLPKRSPTKPFLKFSRLVKLWSLPYPVLGDLANGHLHTTALFSAEFAVTPRRQSFSEIQACHSRHNCLSFDNRRRCNHRNHLPH
jgi:tetratricopeptide (TPR) repeat protein